jgi:hypothetical protein
MHNQFRELLPSATGESKPVIAINLDVRGFSQFSFEVESFDTALYIRKIYERILRDYFPGADFFKPTGDGLLIVIELDETDADDLEQKANLVVGKSLELVESFGTLLEGDSWVYFTVPQKLGIGVARGSATRLTANEMVLDYSGSVLNIASRLMDLARPEGIVIDRTFPIELLKPDLREKFIADPDVYIRSVAEKTATTVSYTAELTEIPPANRRRIDEIVWLTIRESLRLKDLSDSTTFLFDLEKEPLDPAQIFVALSYPAVGANGRRKASTSNEFRPRAEDIGYRTDAGQPRVGLPYGKWARRLKEKGVKPEWPVELLIKYPT